ncbi:thiamine-binding protein [Corynebacterium sp. S7]
MIVAFSVAPTVTSNPSAEMADAVARAVAVVNESGLPHETNAMFTIVEGEWDEVMDVIKRATEAVKAVSPRVSLVIKADIREGYTDQLHQKMDSLNKALDSAKEN